MCRRRTGVHVSLRSRTLQRQRAHRPLLTRQLGRAVRPAASQTTPVHVWLPARPIPRPQPLPPLHAVSRACCRLRRSTLSSFCCGTWVNCARYWLIRTSASALDQCTLLNVQCPMRLALGAETARATLPGRSAKLGLGSFGYHPNQKPGA